VIFKRSNAIDGSMRGAGLWAMGLIMSTSGVVIVNLRMALETRYWTAITHIAIWGSIVIYFLYIYVYAAIYYRPFGFVNVYHVPYELAGTALFWLLLVLAIVMSLIPELVYKYIQWTYFPQDWQVLHERDMFNVTSNAELVRSVKHAKLDGERTAKEKNRSPNSGGYTRELDVLAV